MWRGVRPGTRHCAAPHTGTSTSSSAACNVRAEVPLLLLPGPPSCPLSVCWRPGGGAGVDGAGDRPSYLSGPRRKKPRSAAERLPALETKFLLFEVGQERDSVLSRSPAPHLDCSGRRRAKGIAYKRHARRRTRFRTEKTGGKPTLTLTQDMFRWIDGKIKPSWRTAWSGWTDGRGPTARSLALVGGGRSDPLQVPKIQGTASGQQDDRFCAA